MHPHVRKSVTLELSCSSAALVRNRLATNMSVPPLQFWAGMVDSKVAFLVVRCIVHVQHLVWTSSRVKKAGNVILVPPK